MAKSVTKFTSLFLVVILIFGFILPVSINSGAASYPTTHPNTHKNTGDNIVDITEIARTQIGYAENSVGTKYGYWYTPSFVNQPWCAMFVSWCANQAEISTDVIPKFASCSWGVNWFKTQGRWQDSAYYGGDYTPKKGDIVFYRNSGSSNVSDHVGIVVGLNGQYLDVIEGNATNASCCEFTASSARTLSNKYVIGYGVPDYNGDGIFDDDFEGEEPTTYERWRVSTADYLSLRASYSTTATRLTTIPMGTIIEVTEFYVGEDYLWGKCTYGGNTGWCALNYCMYLNGNINGVYYQLAPSIENTKDSIYINESKQIVFDNSLGARYKSTDTSVVTVAEDGTITGVSAGTANVKCITQTGTAKCKITVNEPTLTNPEISVCIGDSDTLKLVGAYDTVTYRSNNEQIATVDESGVITGVAKGETTVTATVSGVTLKCNVTVTKNPTTYENFMVKTSYTDLYTRANAGAILATAPKGTVLRITKVSYIGNYTWGKTTYNGSVMWAKLNDCSYVNGEINGVTYKIAPYLPVTSANVYLGNTYTITVKHKKSDVTYTSSNPKVASVDEKGVITAVKKGTATITINSYDREMLFTVTVKKPKLNTKSLTLIKGNTYQLNVIGGAGNITYTSSDKTIAKVSKDGLVKAKGYGTATITVVSSGITMTCTVNSYAPTLNVTNAQLKLTDKLKLKVKGNYSTNITYASKDKTIAKVTKKGVIKPVSKGETKIKVYVDGKTLICNVKVKKK